MTYEEITNQKTYWKVLDNTHYTHEKTKKMIGGIFEQRSFCDYDKTVYLWNKDKTDYWWFNLSDLQKMTPVKYKGEYIGIGDEVKCGGNWWKVCDYYWVDDEFAVRIAEIKNGKPNISSSYYFYENNIADLKPLYKQQNIIEINGKKYNKEKVEERLKELEEIE